MTDLDSLQRVWKGMPTMNETPQAPQQPHELGEVLTLIGMDEQSIDLFSPQLHWVKRGQQIHAVSLSFQVEAGVYKRILDHGDFNLSLEVQDDLEGPPFDGETPISIETRLHPQFLFLFEPFEDDLNAGDAFLLSLHETDKANELIHTKNWLATRVSQSGAKGTSRYNTLWHRFDISADTMEKFARGEYNEEIQAFLRNKIGFDLSLLSNPFSPEALNALTGEVAQVVTQELRSLFAILPSEDSEEEEAEYGDWKEEHGMPIERVVAFLEEDGWNYRVAPDGNMIYTGATGQNGALSCQIMWDGENEYLICYIPAPDQTAPHRIADMNEFITRANYGLPSGNFEMNFDTGEVRFRTSIFVADRIPSFDEVEDLLNTAFFLMDDYLTGMMQVNEGVSPSEAITSVENKDSE